MSPTLQILISGGAFAILDIGWFAIIGSFFFKELKHLAQSNDAGTAFAVNLPSAGVVYALMALGVVFLVEPTRRKEWSEVLLPAAIFGLVVYGVYDFTNHATLRAWPWKMMTLDISWGVFSSVVVNLIVWRFCR